MASLKKNVASQNVTFCMISATTGAADASATVTAYVSKDGTQAAASGSVSNLGNGQYNYAPTQAETNATDVGLFFTATGDIPVNLDFHTDVVDANGFVSVHLADILGTAVSTPATAGILDVNIKNMNNVAATSITAVNANIGTTQPINFSGTGASAFVKSDTEQLNAQTVTAAAGVTFPASVASPTNITAGTITTVTNLTNAPTAGDLTATMKTSVTTAVNAATTVGITSNRKKGSTATFEFLMQNSTTGAPQTGLTVASTISKDGGAPANTANAVTEIALGQYQIVLTGTEMTMNNGFLQCIATGALTFNLSIQTQL